ncbi:MAG: NnrU family protein [Pseudomonadota bacterium]
MLLMFAGLALFLGSHSLQILGNLRKTIINTVGDPVYRISYVLVSVAGLILVAEGYKAWKYVDGSAILYVSPAWMSHIALLLMAFAFIALAATYMPGYIKRALKHPMLVAVKVWALAHLLANGDAASVVLFGAFLAWAVVDRISVERRAAADFTTLNTVLAQAKPNALFDVAAVVIGLGVYVLFVWKLHLWLIGVAPVAVG